MLISKASFEIVQSDDPRLQGSLCTTIPVNDTYTILIREDVYNKAYEYEIGGYRMHIMHEISHVVLFKLGYTPKLNKVYPNYYLNLCNSIEWQAKALAGEILIPYDLTKELSVEEIMCKCKVSRDAAIKRKRLKQSW